MDKRVLAATVFLLLLQVELTNSGKVLLLPMIGASHTLNFAQVGGALVKDGHEVYAYVNGDCTTTKRLSKVNIRLITFNNTLGGCVMESEEMVSAITRSLEGTESPGFKKVFELLSAGFPVFKAEVEAALSDQRAILKMKEMDFDIVLVDGLYFNKHVYVIAYMLNKPIVSLMSFFNPFEAGIPALPSIYPMTYAVVTPDMTFLERLKNFAVMLGETFLLPSLLPMFDNNLVSKYVTDRPYKSISQIAGESKLWLVMTDDVIDYPRVKVPSVINIGGMNTKPAHPLPEDLQALADQAKAGIILVSFGSQFLLPNRLLKVLFDTFRDLPQTVFMRHVGGKLENIPANVHVMSWMPQNDILGHPNTQLFITHSGCNGQFEALYHGVPMLALPMLGDQLHNTKRAVYHKVAISLNLPTLTVKELKAGVETVLGDSSYANNARRLSTIFRDRPLTPMQTATYWIDHVIKYGGDDLRPAGSDLSSFQFWCIDLLIFILIISAASTYLMSKFCCCLWGSCCRTKFIPQPSPKKDAKEKAQ